jgi:hypothetical protein
MLQFRLRTLFIATTAAAVLAWAFFAPPEWLGLWAIYLVYFLLPAVTVSGITFHRGYWQAFFIGMAPWAAMVSVCVAAQQIPWFPDAWPINVNVFAAGADEIFQTKLLLAIPLLIAVASGLVGVGMRWWTLTATRRPD